MQTEQNMWMLTRHPEASLRVDTIPKPLGLGSRLGANPRMSEACMMFVQFLFNGRLT
jgi:hypothetical protein